MVDYKQMKDKILEQVDYWKPSGYVSFINKDKVEYNDYYGKRSLQTNEDIDKNTTYCFSSRGMCLISLSILQLIERGKISFEDKLDKFIPEYKHASKITIKHLLCEQSGIKDYFYGVVTKELINDEVYKNLPFEKQFIHEKELYAKGYTFNEVINLIGDMPLEYEPGSREVDDSQSNKVFLAEIVERVTNMSMFEYQQEYIFKVAGMTNTVKGNSANSVSYGYYEHTKRVEYPKIEGHFTFTTTAEDIEKFTIALANGKLLGKDSLKFAKRFNKYGFSCIFTYANGWAIFPIANYMDNYAFALVHLYKNISAVIIHNDPGRNEYLDQSFRSFSNELISLLNDSISYPFKPKVERITSKNCWDAIMLRTTEEQHSFVWSASNAIAYTSTKKHHHMFVLKDCGVVIGLLILGANKKENKYDVNTVLIDKKYQRRGYGKIMVAWGVEWLKNKGAKELTIGVNRHNVGARALYTSLGFSPSTVYEEGIHMTMDLTK